jgi:hypothetical protein
MPKLNNLVKRIRSKPSRYRVGVGGVNAPQNTRAAVSSFKVSETPSNRLSPRVSNEVMSILVSVQWDCWRFMLPAKPIVKLDVAVVSHDDLDHWHPNFWKKDVVLVPYKLHIPDAFASLRNILQVSRTTHISRLRFWCLNSRDLSRLLQRNVEDTHAFWWLVTGNEAKVLFIGDLNVEDVKVALDVTQTLVEKGLELHGVLLPSFGGVTTHGARNPRELSSLVYEFAEWLHRQGMLVASLPHPIPAVWADYNAVKERESFC